MYVVVGILYFFVSELTLSLFQAIDEIGFTPYHAKLFCLNGFGYDPIFTTLRLFIPTCDSLHYPVATEDGVGA